jgi:hypothetical protein
VATTQMLDLLFYTQCPLLSQFPLVDFGTKEETLVGCHCNSCYEIGHAVYWWRRGRQKGFMLYSNACRNTAVRVCTYAECGWTEVWNKVTTFCSKHGNVIIGTSNNYSWEIVQLLLSRVQIEVICMPLYRPYRINSRVGLFESREWDYIKWTSQWIKVFFYFLHTASYLMLSSLCYIQS